MSTRLVAQYSVALALITATPTIAPDALAAQAADAAPTAWTRVATDAGTGCASALRSAISHQLNYQLFSYQLDSHLPA